MSRCSCMAKYFFVQLHVLPLGVLCLVLGTQWISTSCIINWDFKHLTMKFAYGSSHIVLHAWLSKRLELHEDRKNCRIACRIVWDPSNPTKM